jgi:glucokinase
VLLVGDIGATHARLALVSPERGLAHPVREATLASQEYAGLLELVADFLRPTGADVERAVLAVAGPVVGGRAELTNLGWTVDGASLRDGLGVSSVRLLNDLVAMAYAVPHLAPDALRTLQPGVPEAGGTIGVVAPGTGLGEAFLTWDGARYRAYPTEAGHADFAPGDAVQSELLEWLRTRMRAGPVSSEHVCSGRGLPNLYDFLKERGAAREEPWLAERLGAAEDRTPVIVEAALDPRKPSALGVATLELFAAILAAEAGNAALRLLATGGVYLGGGMSRRSLAFLERPGVVARFRQKDRMSMLLARIPLHVIVARKVALLGAAYAAIE